MNTVPTHLMLNYYLALVPVICTTMSGTLTPLDVVPEKLREMSRDDWGVMWRVVNIFTKQVPDFASALYTSVAEAQAAVAASEDINKGRPEIGSILTLYSGHITENTLEMLAASPDTDCLAVTVYPKSEFGHYVYFDGVSDDQLQKLPADLLAAIQLAKALNCNVICFDCDALPIPALPDYAQTEA